MIDLTKFKPQLVGEGDLGVFLFNNDGVFVEPKIDGVRIICQKQNGQIKLYARSSTEWTQRFTSVLQNISKGICGSNIILDGEMAVVQDGKVLSSNSVLQKQLPPGQRFVYFVFDIIQAGDIDMYKEPQLTRKQNLQFIIDENENICLVPFFCTNNIVDIQEFYKKIVQKNIEGIVIKNCSTYHQGQRYNWLKLKPLRTVDLKVIERKDRKDKLGWIYTLAENDKIIGTSSSTLDIQNGITVEVGYDIKYPKEDSYRLRFLKIIRIREDK
jgi:DNA ligase-1